MEKRKQPNSFLKYSTIGMEIAVPIIGGYFGGKYLDELYATGKAWTIGLSLFGVFTGLYLGLKDLIKP